VVASPGSKIMVRRGVVYVKPRDGDPVPVTADVELLVLATGAVSISGRALRRLAELGVRVLVLGQRGQVVGDLRPVDRVNKTIEARIAQYRAIVSGASILYAAEIVYSKIVNQARVVRYLAKSRREPWAREQSYRIEEYASRIRERLEKGTLDVDGLRGLEAHAAQRYWQLIASLMPGDWGFHGRNPLAGDPFNTALNYSYAILYGIVYDALIVAGLDPYAGLMHTPKSGKESLVYDYSEMYKPLIDKELVLKLKPGDVELIGGSLTYNSRRTLSRIVLETLRQYYSDSTGKRRRLRDHIYAYAWSLAMSLRELRSYDGFKVRL